MNEINEASFVNLANKCVGDGLIPTGIANFELAKEYAKQEIKLALEWAGNHAYDVIQMSSWENDELFNLFQESKEK